MQCTLCGPTEMPGRVAATELLRARRTPSQRDRGSDGPTGPRIFSGHTAPVVSSTPPRGTARLFYGDDALLSLLKREKQMPCGLDTNRALSPL